ncbi:MAG: hypothetical protein ACR2M3_14395 [Thermomicrobiales bacterium]
MTKEAFLDRVEHFDPVTESADLLAFLDRPYPLFRGALTDTEHAWIGDRASTASMTVALQTDTRTSPMPMRQVATIP